MHSCVLYEEFQGHPEPIWKSLKSQELFPNICTHQCTQKLLRSIKWRIGQKYVFIFLHLCFSAWQQLNGAQVLHLRLTYLLHISLWVSLHVIIPKNTKCHVSLCRIYRADFNTHCTKRNNVSIRKEVWHGRCFAKRLLLSAYSTERTRFFETCWKSSRWVGVGVLEYHAPRVHLACFRSSIICHHK